MEKETEEGPESVGLTEKPEQVYGPILGEDDDDDDDDEYLNRTIAPYCFFIHIHGREVIVFG